MPAMIRLIIFVFISIILSSNIFAKTIVDGIKTQASYDAESSEIYLSFEKHTHYRNSEFDTEKTYQKTSKESYECNFYDRNSHLLLMKITLDGSSVIPFGRSLRKGVLAITIKCKINIEGKIFNVSTNIYLDQHSSERKTYPAQVEKIPERYKPKRRQERSSSKKNSTRNKNLALLDLDTNAESVSNPFKKNPARSEKLKWIDKQIEAIKPERYNLSRNSSKINSARNENLKKANQRAREIQKLHEEYEKTVEIQKREENIDHKRSDESSNKNHYPYEDDSESLLPTFDYKTEKEIEHSFINTPRVIYIIILIIIFLLTYNILSYHKNNNNNNNNKNFDESLETLDKLMIDTALYMSFLDTANNKKEIILIAKYFNLPRLKLHKYGQKIKKDMNNNSSYIIEILLKINNLTDEEKKYSIFKLCLNVAAADGIADKKEIDLANLMAKKLSLDPTRYKKMIKEILPITMYREDQIEEILEAALGIQKNMSDEEIRKILMQEAKKWRSIASHSDAQKREQAEKMIHKTSELRKKYS